MQGKKFYVGLGVLVLVIALVDVVYFSRLAVAEAPAEAPAAEVAEAAPAAEAVAAPATPTAPSPMGTCEYDQNVPAVENYEQLVTFSDPFEGNASSGVQVLEFFDPNCPHCKTMHPIMKRVIATHGDQAQFFMIPFIVFPQSLNQIEALYVAAQDGKFSEMIDAQFAVQKSSGLSIQELASIAADLGMDPEVFTQRVSRGLNRSMIASRREQIRSLGVGGVPTVMINGRLIRSEAKTVACLQEMIEAAAPAD
ncbi:MAG: thioredoxin domain-containing protein [Rhodothermales bacterium]|nr:thioredoxin domain-containing protein [Rhodothermales bacterium]